MAFAPRWRRIAACGLSLLALACSSGSGFDEPSESVAAVSEALSVGGCGCVEGGSCADLSYANIPADGVYAFTTFGGPGGGTMSCGGVADGTWPYVAGRARFGCGTKLLIEKGGLSCVAQVADCGPNRCVEEAACECSCTGHTPTIAASPLIAQHLLGVSSAGWSEKISVKATVVGPASVVGCPGAVVNGAGGAGSAGGAGGSSGGGLAGAPSSGGSAGSGAPSECAPPVCACGSCYDDCLCDTGDVAHCADSCGLGSAGSAGASSAAGSTGSGCSGAPDCNGCGSCYDQCRCQYKSDQACLEQCSKSDQVPSVEKPASGAPSEPAPKPACAARIAGGASSSDFGTWLAIALLALARLRRRR